MNPMYVCSKCFSYLMRFQWLGPYMRGGKTEYWYMLCSNPLCEAFDAIPRFLPVRFIA